MALERFHKWLKPELSLKSKILPCQLFIPALRWGQTLKKGLGAHSMKPLWGGGVGRLGDSLYNKFKDLLLAGF